MPLSFFKHFLQNPLEVQVQSLQMMIKVLPLAISHYIRLLFCVVHSLFHYHFSGNHIFSEPIGSSSPKFGNDEKSATYVRKLSNDISILCNAQAFPYPNFR